MSFWLTNKRTNYELNNYWYREILCLAKKFGWKPAGTKGAMFYNEDGTIWQDFRKGWKGWYFSNDFQTVTSKDARNIAKALKNAKRVGKSDDYSMLDDFIKFCGQGSYTSG